MSCTQMPTRPLRMAQDRCSPSDWCRRRGVSAPRGCQGPVCAYGSRYRLSPHLALQEQVVMKKPDMACRPSGNPRSTSPIQAPTSVRVCRTCLTPRPSLKGVTCSPLSGTTCLPDRQQCPTRPSGAVVNRPVGYNSMGAAGSASTGI